MSRTLLLLSLCFPILAGASAFGQGTVSGTLAADTTLALAGSPWTATSMVTVPTGVTLTVEAGVRVEFDDGAGVLIDGGRLIANGTAASPIVFGRAAGATHTWDGFRFIDTLEDNRLTHFSMEYGDDRGDSIEIDRARLTIQFGAWPTTEETVIEMDHPSVLIEHSAIPGISGGEVVHGNDISGSEYLILRSNTFGKASNGGDVIDFTGAEAPGPILHIIDNVFMGGDDDGLDLDGTDAFISGNIFMDFRKDPANSRSTTSNAVATGLPQSGAPNRTRVTMTRNLFINCDHAVLLKEEAFLTATNNTFVGMQLAVIQFDEAGGTAVQGPGKGAILDGNIFHGNAQMFKHLIASTELTINRCLIEPTFHDRGIDNLSADPGFLDEPGGDYSLQLGSPAIGTGPNGLDMGYLVSGGASISGEPLPTTWRTEANLIVGGPAIVAYRYRLNGGAWSGDTPIGNPIVLSGLSGANTVEVVGQNTIGEWQLEAQATTSRTWVVDPAVSRLVINEVDAHTQRVELTNDSGAVVDFNGMALSDEAGAPAKYVISGTPVVQPGDHLVVIVPTLRSNGGTVFFHDAMGAVLDSVAYGLQIVDHSIGRIGPGQEWMLCQPTLGGPNIAQATALNRSLKVNEWLLQPECLFRFEFVELFNPEFIPTALGGMSIDVEPILSGDPWFAAPLSFIGPRGFTAVIADGDLAAGADHATFEAFDDLGTIISLSHGGQLIDGVSNNSSLPDVSRGRRPSGTDEFETFALPTPGFDVTTEIVETVTPLVAIDDVWSYEDSNTDLGTAWQEVLYDDATWSSGGGLLGRETNPQNLPESLVTPINYVAGIPTYYFRHHFNFSGNPANVTLRLRTVVDDGVVIYLNGDELHRLRMDDPVAHGEFANDNIGDADYEGPFDKGPGSLAVGDNVLAAEAHQDDGGSSDIVFGMELEAVESTTVTMGLENAEAILAGLRLTEIMYHPAGDGAAEYLELQNIGSATLELEGLRFVEGVEFVFPAMSLAPGEFVYVVRDVASFNPPNLAALTVAGQYVGDVDDDGEQLRLELPFGAAVVDTTYTDFALGSDGGGNSLELFDVSITGLKDGEWTPSSESGGTPGAHTLFENNANWVSRVFTPAEAADPLISGPDRDPDGDGMVNLLERAFGRNPMVVDADWHPEVAVENGMVVLRFTRSTSAGDIDVQATYSEDLALWQPNVPGIQIAIVSEGGGTQTLEARVPVEALGRGFLRLEMLLR